MDTNKMSKTKLLQILISICNYTGSFDLKTSVSAITSFLMFDCNIKMDADHNYL